MPIKTKWPRLLVVGEPISPEQADEILVRTNEWGGFTNDKAWEESVHAALEEVGYPKRPVWNHPATEENHAAGRAFWADLCEWNKRMRILELGYLRNSRVASAWIGGPHGWCDWDGRIGTTNYNIGKWPSDEEITADWEAIAAAFPYLDLTAQLVDEEGDGELAGQWRVNRGRVEYDPAPVDVLCDVWNEPDMLACLVPGGEHGCSIDRLRQALHRIADNAPATDPNPR